MKNYPILFLIALIYLPVDVYSAEWYEDQDGNFKIDFYTEPVKESRPVFYSFGSYTATTLSVNEPDDLNESYSILYFDIPSTKIHSDSLGRLFDFFTTTQTDFYRSLGETNLDHLLFLKINGYPGREFAWSDPSSETTLTRRLFLVRSRLYVLEVVNKFVNQHNINILKFLNSFALLDSTENLKKEVEPEILEKKFSIAYPGQTVTRDQYNYGPFGLSALKMEMFQPNNGKSPDESNNFAYGVAYGSYNKDSIAKLTEDQKHDYIKELIHTSSLITNGGKIINETEANFNNNWCLISNDLILDGRLVIEIRCFIKENYLYQISVMSKPGFEGNAASKKFFDSFKFTP